MAEMLFRHMLAERNLSDLFEVDSCATSTEEIGHPIYPAARRCLEAHGVPLVPHRARQITRADYAHFDLILCMENYNLRNLSYVLGADLLAQENVQSKENKLSHTDLFSQDQALPSPKIRRLLPRDVADPWYTGDFETTYRDLLEGCTSLLSTLHPQL